MGHVKYFGGSTAKLLADIIHTHGVQVQETENAAGVLSGVALLHHADAEVLFPQFCEALVRIAQGKYYYLESIEKRVQTLLANDILPLKEHNNGIIRSKRGNAYDNETRT